MNTKHLIISGLVALLAVIIFGGCMKDNFDLDKLHEETPYAAGLAVPVVSGKVDVADVVRYYDQSGTIIENEDGFASIVYKASVKSDTVQRLLRIDDQHFEFANDIPNVDYPGFNEAGDEYTIDLDTKFQFTFFNDDAEIDSMLLQKGTLSLDVSTTIKHSFEILITLPSCDKSGTQLTLPLPTDPPLVFRPGNRLRDVHIDVPLAGYKVDFTKTGNHNEIPVKVKIILSHSGFTDNGGNLTIKTDIKGIEYGILHGYFGYNELIYQKNEIDISLFDSHDWTIEDYLFKDPKLKVRYWNSYGVPSQFQFETLEARTVKAPGLIDMIHATDDEHNLPTADNPKAIDNATVAGEVQEGFWQIDNTNSEIDQLINQRPKTISFNAKAITNPDRAAMGHRNFIASNSEIAVDVLLELPMWGYIYRFVASDTSAFELKDYLKHVSPKDTVVIRTYFRNKLPAEVLAQLVFLDEYNQPIDSLFVGNDSPVIIPAAKVDSDGRATGYEEQNKDIVLTKTRVQKLQNCKKLITRFTANTTDATNDEQTSKVIKMYADYGIEFKVGVKAIVNVDENDWHEF